ncbi:hypothetical protein A7985_08935 [Pseudoalteromonas luteoviolacea]|uniref:DUF2163 domain-containing protein n=1 Tax=Pseudoalteromonas luteoviolacea TaxID=43657 RepID=A0A1C0TRN4_9GAMM|nr:hypothetical protein [Pseudoalteromonas luteoviolacea]OCQ21923.1 hypothetical protein A7985_08935 [Pseudoalteromonas luteoviolacea]
MEALNRALVAELAQCRPRYFVRLAFKSGDVLLHTGVGERRFLGRTWFGLGMLGRIGEIPANDKNDAARIRLSLHTQSDAILGEVAENDPIGVGVEIYLVTVDKHYRVNQSQLLESGYIVACDVERGQVSTVMLSVAGESERWKQSRVHQRWNHATQIALYPEDKFFSEHSAATSTVLPDTQPGSPVGGRDGVHLP